MLGFTFAPPLLDVSAARVVDEYQVLQQTEIGSVVSIVDRIMSYCAAKFHYEYRGLFLERFWTLEQTLQVQLLMQGSGTLL